MTPKYIYWFAYFNTDEPSVRYRANYPLAQLKEQHGIGYSIVYPGYDIKTLLRFVLTYLEVLLFRRKDSIIVFQKICSFGIYANALKLLLFFRHSKTLYDIDDAEYTRIRADTIHYFMKNCEACSAGSVSLMEYIRQFNPNVFFLTSPVIEHYFHKGALNGVFTLGWIGYYGAHRSSLMTLLFPALKKVGFPIKLTLLGVKNEDELLEIQQYFASNSDIEISAPLGINWLDEDSIYDRIRLFDLGVSPLLDNEFNRGKSAFKLKQCLSAGVPVIGSRVGENSRFLVDGKNGYLCDTADDFLAAIQYVKGLNLSEYTRLSSKAKDTFPEFSVDNYCAVLLGYYAEKGNFSINEKSLPGSRKALVGGG